MCIFSQFNISESRMFYHWWHHAISVGQPVVGIYLSMSAYKSTWLLLLVAWVENCSPSIFQSANHLKIFRETNMGFNCCLKTLLSGTNKKALTWRLAEWVSALHLCTAIQFYLLNIFVSISFKKMEIFLLHSLVLCEIMS